jgi:hypothetical protein
MQAPAKSLAESDRSGAWIAPARRRQSRCDLVLVSACSGEDQLRVWIRCHRDAQRALDLDGRAAHALGHEAQAGGTDRHSAPATRHHDGIVALVVGDDRRVVADARLLHPPGEGTS